MNTYFVTIVQNMKDGTQPINTIGYVDLNSAMMAYHQTCASSRANENMTGYICMVFNEHGNTEIKEYYKVATPEPEEA